MLTRYDKIKSYIQMKTKILSKFFFSKPTLSVSKNLLGKFLVRRINGKKVSLMINEVEAYLGSKDLACHSARGKTKRNAPMYEEGGTIYVYFVYGMHYMLNIVTRNKGCPEAVLIRGAGRFSGPARLTRALGIDLRLYGKKLSKNSGLWIEDRGIQIAKNRIKKTPRIGVDYAGAIWSKKLYRFVYQEPKV